MNLNELFDITRRKNEEDELQETITEFCLRNHKLMDRLVLPRPARHGSRYIKKLRKSKLGKK
jgi:hypothetical protein